MTQLESTILRALAILLRAQYAHNATRKQGVDMIAEIDNLINPHQAKATRWFIKLHGEELYMGTAIDSGGMSAYWISKRHADPFTCRGDAVAFMDGRLRERFPDARCSVVELAP